MLAAVVMSIVFLFEAFDFIFIPPLSQIISANVWETGDGGLS